MDNNLTIGVKEVDSQHKKLFQMINRLHEELLKGHGPEILNSTIASMVKYVLIHFATEENIMKNYGYPGYEDHKKEHAKFVSRVMRFQKKHRLNSPLLAREILMFLGGWYRDHIVNKDGKIGDFIRQQS